MQKQRKKSRQPGDDITRQLVELSHDMRTPLSIILSTVQLLEDRGDPQNERELAQIRRNAHQLQRLIGNIIDTARIDAGRLQMHMHPLELIAWLREVTLACAPYAQYKGVEFSFAANCDALWVRCDPVKLERCVLNLVANAVRHTDAGGLICLSAEHAPPLALISVSDNGSGIDKRKQRTLFRRFGSLQDGSKSGVGLGLSLVKSFVEAMGGCIEVESELGEGTCARLSLPAVEKPEAGEEGFVPYSGAPGVEVELAELMRPTE